MVPVKVPIVSWNKNDPEGPSTFIAFGKMTEKGGVTYVRYEESKLTGMDKTTTTLKWSELALSIIRHGSFALRQHYAISDTVFFPAHVRLHPSVGNEAGRGTMGPDLGI